MPQQNTKQLVDMGLGTAITCSFSIPEVGPGIAAVLSTGKLVFDLFYDDKTGVDPLSRTPTMADLKNAMNDLETKVAADIWSNSKGIDQSVVERESDAIMNAIRQAGAKPKQTAKAMSGDTTVWDNGDLIKFFDPLNPSTSSLLSIADMIEGKVSDKYGSIGLYTLTVGVYLSYCKTATTWEVNENLKDYNARHDAWQVKTKAHKYWALTKSGPEPDKPPPEPTVPTDGDYAVGSEVVDQASGVVRSYRSYLGNKKGLNNSKFVQYALDQLPTRLKYLDGLISGWSTARADRETFVTGYLDQVTVQPVTSGGASMFQWVNAIDQTKGTPVSSQTIAQMQADMEKGKMRGKYEAQWANNNTNPDSLTAADIKTLKSTAAEWQNSLDTLTHKIAAPAP